MAADLPILDPLDAEILAKEAARTKLKRDLEAIDIEINTLRRAAQLRPAPLNGLSHKNPHFPRQSGLKLEAPVRGKAPGTIANHWREIMGIVVDGGNLPLNPDYWVIAAEQVGHPMNVKTVRDWLRRGAGYQNGFIGRSGEGYFVTEAAIKRFNLKTAEPPPEVPATALLSPAHRDVASIG